MAIKPTYEELEQRIRELEKESVGREREEEAPQRSVKEALRLVKEYKIMADIGRVISSTMNIDEVYKAFSEKVRELLPFDRIVINLIDHERNSFSVSYLEGVFVSGRQRGDVGPLKGTVIEQILRTRKGFIVQMESVVEIEKEYPGLLPEFQHGIRSALTVPLISKDQVMGGLALRSTESGSYTDRDLRLAGNIANQIAGAISNAQFFVDRKRAEEEKEKLQNQLFQLRKAESLGRMAGAVAHHYNNLMSVVMGNLEMTLGEEPDRSRLQENLSAAMKASRRAADISHLMLAYLGQSIGKRELIDLSEVCREALSSLTRSMPQRPRLKTEFPPSGPIIQGNTGQIKQVLSNLVTNAVEAIGKGDGHITVGIGVTPATDIPELSISPAGWKPKDETYAWLSITDTGCGMDPETVEKVFDPFFSTKEGFAPEAAGKRRRDQVRATSRFP